MRAPIFRLCLALVLVGLAPAAHAAKKAGNGSLPLAMPLIDGWDLQSSAKVSESGEVLSTTGYAPKNWHSVSVPTTVVAALVKNKTYPDPYFGMNIRQIPGTTYEIGSNFSNANMAKDSPFAVPWWYRKRFDLPAAWKGKTIWMSFEGINFRASIWVNGKRVADGKDLAGPWRTYELNVTDVVKFGAPNVVAVEVTAQTPTDLGITFVDWNPAPPDKNLGLWRAVTVHATGPVAVRYPAVFTKLNSPANDKAELTVTALVKNGSKEAVTGKLRGRFGKITFEQPVQLAPGEKKDVTFTPAKFAQLVLEKPRLWWPAQMGTPVLHEAELDFEVGGKVSDEQQTTFGIREIRSELDADKGRVFFVNGKRVLIRGAGWSSDMMMREDPARIEDELRYVLDMGLNTVRLEGKLENKAFLDFTDKHGLLVMAGWCCCDHWEEWGKWEDEDHRISAEMTRDQLYRLRAHASLFSWLNSSDNPPPPAVEQRYLDVAKAVQWPHPVLSSASAKPAKLTGVTGVKMLGPYDWVPPKYWLEDVRYGGAHGFNSETSAGPAIPPVESLKRMFPPDKLWPINEHWNFHAGGQQFKNMDIYIKALEARHGKATSVEDFAMKSQLLAYEGVRAMFEAFTRNKYKATGVIQWMLNNAWPGLIWHLYDYYLRPAGGYFATKKAMEPLHPIYSYNDGSIWVANSTYEAARGLKVSAKVMNLDASVKHSNEAAIDLGPDESKKAFDLPVVDGLDKTFLLRLQLHDSKGKLVSTNDYWLSTERETLSYGKTTWYYTPTKTFADMKGLDQLPKVALKSSAKHDRGGEWSTSEVTVENPGKNIAFFIRLKVNGAGGEEALPVFWDDNYFTLMPGERREVKARYRTRDLGGGKPAVEIDGWNVK